MKKLESAYKRTLMRKLKSFEEGFFFSKEALALRGFPDIMGCFRGRFIALECKRNDCGATEKTGRIVLQRFILALIKKSGG